MYGSCEKLTHNTNFIKQDETGSQFYFRGFGWYMIKQIDEEWRWTDESTNTTIASLNLTTLNYPFGRHLWKIENRSICNQKQGMKMLLLTACHSGTFTCDDGTCILHDQRCDFKYDCEDHSDEINCDFVVLPDDYKVGYNFGNIHSYNSFFFQVNIFIFCFMYCKSSNLITYSMNY